MLGGSGRVISQLDNDCEPVGRSFSLHNGYWQVLFVAIIAFCCPGMFNALNGMGGAGSANPNINSFVNFCLYATFAVFGYAGGLFFNYLGPRALVIFGGSTYALYTGMAYAAQNPATSSWGDTLFVVSGAVLGIGAAMFWTAQGSIMMAYAPQNKKGSYISLFWIIFNLGGVMGGLLGFGVNFNSHSAGSSADSYFTFVGIMVVGALLGFLIVKPSTVIREDGIRASAPPLKTFSEEIRDALLVCTDHNMIRLSVLFFASNFFYTYVFNSVNGKLHTVRTRGLNSAFFWAAQMVGAVAFARVVDRERYSIFIRARQAFIFVTTTMTISWAFGIYLQLGYAPAVTALRTGAPLIDCNSADWIYSLVTMILYGLADSLIQTFSYWIMSVLAGDNAQLAARYAGFYKGVQSLGAAIAWLLDSTYIALGSETQMWICIGLFILASLPTIWVVRDLAQIESESKSCNHKNVEPHQQIAQV